MDNENKKSNFPPTSATEASLNTILNILHEADWKSGMPDAVNALFRFAELLLQCCNASMAGKMSEAIDLKKQLTAMRIEQKIPEAHLTALFVRLLQAQHVPSQTSLVAIAHRITTDPKTMAIHVIALLSPIIQALPTALLNDLLSPTIKKNLFQALKIPASHSFFFKPAYASIPAGKLEEKLQGYLRYLNEVTKKHTETQSLSEKPEGHYLKKKAAV